MVWFFNARETRVIYGVLKPDVHKAVKGQTLDIGDWRVRQNSSPGSINLSLGRALLRNSLGCSKGKGPHESQKSLLGEHIERSSLRCQRTRNTGRQGETRDLILAGMAFPLSAGRIRCGHNRTQGVSNQSHVSIGARLTGCIDKPY